jgi:hypothetical protein
LSGHANRDQAALVDAAAGAVHISQAHRDTRELVAESAERGPQSSMHVIVNAIGQVESARVNRNRQAPSLK